MNWIKENFLAIKQVVKETQRLVEQDLVQPRLLGKTTAFGGVGMYLSPLTFLSLGAIPCGAIVSKRCTRGANEEYLILVNEAFLETDKEVQEAIVAHELGHLVSGHLTGGVWEARGRTVARLLGHNSVLQRELEADKVAIDEGHKKGLLRFLQKVLWLAPQNREAQIRYQIALERTPAAKGVANNMLDAIYRRLR